MISKIDHEVLNSIFLPKELMASSQVAILQQETDTAQENAPVVISFTNPYQKEGYSVRSFHYINNPDGTIRWIFPTDADQPDFLNFYHSSTLRSKAFSAGVKTAFLLGLKHRVCSGTMHVSARGETRIEQTLSELKHDHYSIFTGTCGKNRSFLAAVCSQGRPTHFLKGMIDPAESDLIYNEYDKLMYADSIQLSNTVTPGCNIVKGDLIQENVKPIDGAEISTLSEEHFATINELYRATATTQKINTSEFADTILNGLDQVLPTKVDDELAAHIIAHKEVLNESRSIPMAMAHGDFTPWNMYVSNSKLHVFDWELSMEKAPMLFDLFHFIFQSERFLNNGSSTAIENRLQRMLSHPTVCELVEEFNIDVQLHLRLYVLYMVAYYLPQYQRETKMNPQQLAQLKTWTEQLYQLTPMMKDISHRKLFLQAFTDVLAETEHAMLKFRHKRIQELSEFSDLDILVRKRDVPVLMEFARSSTLVAKCRVLKKSFMTVISIYFKDGSFLSLDLIYSFKRKSIVFLDANKVLETALTDHRGIKRAHPQYDLHYSFLFYVINGASIPESYKNHFLWFNSVREEDLLGHINSVFNLGFTCYDELFLFTNEVRTKLLTVVNGYAKNRGLKAIGNQINYVSDTLKDMFSGTGMLITFSGVDGAGKSTIIEDIKTELSKTYRKEVVLLRHRPAVLPILSAFKHGTEKANKITSTRLPRQGTNKSNLSSLIRFAYYLLDYMVGQVYVKLKYTMRGKIVLYDRYYFDFIHDAKRTNIVLPPWFMKLFYPLITKPRLNFFLYAPSDVILARKRELKKHEIEDLTQRYGTHFDTLSLKYKSDVYRKIKNMDREKTVDRILADYRSVA